MPKSLDLKHVMYIAGPFGLMPPQQLFVPDDHLQPFLPGKRLPQASLPLAGAAPGDPPPPRSPLGAAFFFH